MSLVATPGASWARARCRGTSPAAASLRGAPAAAAPAASRLLPVQSIRQQQELQEQQRRPHPCRAVLDDSESVPFTSDSTHLDDWSPDSWRNFTALQQPDYPDESEVRKAFSTIANLPPLIFAGECRTLQDRLSKCATGESFALFGGDCAESFTDFSANRIRDTYRVLLQSALVSQFGGGVPVVKLGRMAGQFAKPRSTPTEVIDGMELPSYRGDIINSPEATPEARVHNPWRLVQAYNQSAATLNLLRGFSSGGYADLHRVVNWNLDFMANTEEGQKYMDLAERVKEALDFMAACGIDSSTPAMRETEFYTSHECLLMEYEEALTRVDSTTGLWYDCSAHFLWIGERTRQLDNSHVEFMRGIANPIGVKVSDKMDPSDLVSLVSTVNPRNVPGRIGVIVRMGADKLREKLPALIEAIQQSGQIVTWICDPMHGNTESCNGYKTRRYENVKAEVEAFFDVHVQCGSVPGGIHLEMTGDDVTECIGGCSQVTATDLSSRYHTHCDPRLNAEQALELAFYIASRLRQRKNMGEKAKAKK